MTDVMKKYKKQELFKNIWFGVLAFVVGFWISDFMNNNSINPSFLKADINQVKIENSSILEKENIEKKDFYIEKSSDNIYNISLKKEISNPLNIWLTITFDEKQINIEEIKTLNENFEVFTLNKTSGITIISVVPKSKQEKLSWKILELKIKNNWKLWDFSFINIINANYSDKNETYNITTSWINVF